MGKANANQNSPNRFAEGEHLLSQIVPIKNQAVCIIMIGTYLSTVPFLLSVPAFVWLSLSFFFLFGLWLIRWPARKVVVKPMRASSFRPESVPQKLDTIVIGSGSGGCACANLLAQAGQRVLLLEQHYRTGGCTHTFREEVRKQSLTNLLSKLLDL